MRLFSLTLASLKFLLLAGIGVLMLRNENAHANIFGPTNFEECVLNHMKGQDASVLSTARRLCHKKFPAEQLLNNNLVESNWCGASQTKQTICIQNVNAGIEVTRISVSFTTAHCSSLNQNTTYVVAEGKKGRFSNKVELTTPSANYNCSFITHYGYDRR